MLSFNFIVYSRHFFDKRMGQEVDGEVLGEEYKGYIFKISGGNDKQGFPMKQGVLVNGRVRLLLTKSKILFFLFNIYNYRDLYIQTY